MSGSIINPFISFPSPAGGGAWDLTGATYNGGNLDVSTQVSVLATGISFADSGSKLFVLDDASGTSDTVYRYDLTTPYDLNTASYAGNSKDTAGDTITGIYMRNDGNRMFLVERVGVRGVEQWDLSTPFDLTTATYIGTFDPVAAGSNLIGQPEFSPDGLKMLVMDDSETVFQYTLGTAWVVSTASYDSISLSIAGEITSLAYGLKFGDSGNKLFTASWTDTSIFRYDLPTPYSLSGGSYDTGQVLDVSSQVTKTGGIDFNPDGSRVFIIGDLPESVFQYDM